MYNSRQSRIKDPCEPITQLQQLGELADLASLYLPFFLILC